jgi:hypothetical protein
MKNDWLKNVPIASVKVGTRYRKDLGDLGPLKSSIRDVGLLQPIGITPDHELVFGERRLKACKELGHKNISVLIITSDSMLQCENDENSDDVRKSFTNSEKLAIARAIKEEVGERRGRPSGGDNNSAQLRGIEIPKGEETREIAAKAAGFSNRDEMRRAEIVDKSCCQDIKDAVDDETVALSDAARVAEEPTDIQEEALKKVIYQEAPTLVAAVKLVRQERREAGVADDEQFYDILGNLIPASLMRVVEDALIFQEIQETAKWMRQKLDDLDTRPSASNRTTAGRLQEHCLIIERAMCDERFGFVCPACRGEGGHCGTCLGKRWFIAADKGKVAPLKIKQTA